MKLWLISTTRNIGYDEYDAAVVAAETEEQARQTHPGEYLAWSQKKDCWVYKSDQRSDTFDEWLKPNQLSIKYLGEAQQDILAGVVLSSFNAG